MINQYLISHNLLPLTSAECMKPVSIQIHINNVTHKQKRDKAKDANSIIDSQ